MDVPLLWRFAISHFTEKARIALGWNQVDRALDRLERETGPSGYLAGDRFSASDPGCGRSIDDTAAFRRQSAANAPPSAPPPGTLAPSTAWPQGPRFGAYSRVAIEGGAARR
jgi:hypothetical protein